MAKLVRSEKVVFLLYLISRARRAHTNPDLQTAFVDPSTVCERCGDEIGEDADGMGDVFGYGWCGPCTMEFALERGN